MITTTDNEIADTLRTALPGISAEEIQRLEKDARILQHLRATHGWMLNSITGLLFKYDVDGVAFDGRELVEYDNEAAHILLKLPNCASADDLQRVIHSEMIDAFDGRTKSLAEYAALAQDVWQLWRVG